MTGNPIFDEYANPTCKRSLRVVRMRVNDDYNLVIFTKKRKSEFFSGFPFRAVV